MADRPLTEVVAAGDLRQSLEALRDHLAGELENGVACVRCGGPVSTPTPALAKQLRDVLELLDGMRTPEGSKSDELKQQVAQQRAGVASRATARRQRRPAGDRARG